MDNTETQFNIAIQSLMRIHELLQCCHYHSKLSVADGADPRALSYWAQDVISLYREIYPKLNKVEINDLKQKFTSLNKIGEVVQTKKTAEGSMRIVDKDRFTAKYNTLSRIEITLRKYADNKGMLMPNKKDTSDAAAMM